MSLRRSERPSFSRNAPTSSSRLSYVARVDAGGDSFPGCCDGVVPGVCVIAVGTRGAVGGRDGVKFAVDAVVEVGEVRSESRGIVMLGLSVRSDLRHLSSSRCRHSFSTVPPRAGVSVMSVRVVFINCWWRRCKVIVRGAIKCCISPSGAVAANMLCSVRRLLTFNRVIHTTSNCRVLLTPNSLSVLFTRVH